MTPVRVDPARARLPALALALVAALAACGSGDGGRSDPASAPAVPRATVPETTTTTLDPHATLMAFSAGPEITAFDAPEDGAASHVVRARDGAPDQRVVLRVREERGAWLRVQLPERPNERTGWVRRDGVDLGLTRMKIRIELAARRLVVTDGGRPVLDHPVTIGAPQWPTPTGSFYVTEVIAAANPRGAYGPYAVALAAFSDVFTEFAGGPGQVAIHGTNRPDQIGQAASHGCVRLPNDRITELTTLVPVGTPVDIVA